jgi:hypothetical protein
VARATFSDANHGQPASFFAAVFAHRYQRGLAHAPCYKFKFKNKLYIMVLSIRVTGGALGLRRSSVVVGVLLRENVDVLVGFEVLLYPEALAYTRCQKFLPITDFQIPLNPIRFT